MAPVLTRRAAPERAFERIYRRHVADVYRYSFAVLRNRDDAEDVTQTTFMNAYRAFQRGERPEEPKNWLIAIAHNVCRQRFRQAQRRPQETMLFEDASELAVEEPEHEFTADDIQRALGHLAFNQRAALVMRELEGRSYAEIAQIMGVTVGAVETLIFRGRRALREQLEGTLTCAQAELALSKQADGMLPRAERGQLRAHLRECKECSTFARRQRATRSALKALGALPLPSSLLGLFGGGGVSVGAGVAAKAAAVVFAGIVVGGVGYEGAHRVYASPRPVAQSAAVAPPVRAKGIAVAHVSTAKRLVAPVRRSAMKPTFERPKTKPRPQAHPLGKVKVKQKATSRPVTHVVFPQRPAHPVRVKAAKPTRTIVHPAHPPNAKKPKPAKLVPAVRHESKTPKPAKPKAAKPTKLPKPVKVVPAARQNEPKTPKPVHEKQETPQAEPPAATPPPAAAADEEPGNGQGQGRTKP